MCELHVCDDAIRYPVRRERKQLDLIWPPQLIVDRRSLTRYGSSRI